MRNNVPDVSSASKRQPGLGEDDSEHGDPLRVESHALHDYYRFPPGCVPSLMSQRTDTRRGYFRLGQDTICYGRLSLGDTADAPTDELRDALHPIRIETSSIEIPFDAGEVIENLRHERYTAHFRDEGHAFNAVLRKAYYCLRPYLSVPVRRHLQKIHLRGWRKIRFPAWPVDCTVERIHQQLLALAMRANGLQKIPFIWFWPHGFNNCLIMTHDVEDPAGRDFCSHLMDIDESFGFRSAFQIIPENRYSVSRSFLESITSRGFEVNVHDLKHDGRLYADHKEFLRRAKHINNYVRDFGAKGFRSGILYRNADWYGAFEFSYDMSIPNVGHLDPQPGGCCTVMPYFIGNIVELPLTCTQDYTLINILDDYSIDLWKQQAALISRNYGLLSFGVHPDYIITLRARAVYMSLLSYLSDLRSEGETWTPLPGEVAAWWRERSQMKVVPDGCGWRIEGVGKEKARVAYARLSGDIVTYGFEA